MRYNPSILFARCVELASSYPDSSSVSTGGYRSVVLDRDVVPEANEIEIRNTNSRTRNAELVLTMLRRWNIGFTVQDTAIVTDAFVLYQPYNPNEENPSTYAFLIRPRDQRILISGSITHKALLVDIFSSGASAWNRGLRIQNYTEMPPRWSVTSVDVKRTFMQMLLLADRIDPLNSFTRYVKD